MTAVSCAVVIVPFWIAGFNPLVAVIGVFLMQISQQNVLSCANPPRNRLADRSGPNDDHNISQCLCFHKVLGILN